MKIKTDYVPDFNSHCITKNKEYKVNKVTESNWYITSDNGGESFRVRRGDGCIWSVVEERPFDIGEHEFSGMHNMTADCDGKHFHFENIEDSCAFIALNKADSIAIAKALGVKGEDLL